MSVGHLDCRRQKRRSSSVSTSHLKYLSSTCPISLANYHHFPPFTFCFFFKQFVSPGFLSLLATESGDSETKGSSKMRLLRQTRSSYCPIAPRPAACSCFSCLLKSCGHKSRGNLVVQGWPGTHQPSRWFPQIRHL